MKRIALVCVLSLMAVGCHASSEDSILKVALEGRECTIDKQGQKVCRFKFGDDLDFEIVDIGSSYVSVIILKAKNFEDADYYLKFGGVHGCIIISRSGDLLGGFAFINPRTAEIFAAYESCWPEQ